MAEKHAIPIDILSDATSEVLKKYRLWFAVPAEVKALYLEKFGINLEKYNGAGRAVGRGGRHDNHLKKEGGRLWRLITPPPISRSSATSGRTRRNSRRSISTIMRTCSRKGSGPKGRRR